LSDGWRAAHVDPPDRRETLFGSLAVVRFVDDQVDLATADEIPQAATFSTGHGVDETVVALCLSKPLQLLVEFLQGIPLITKDGRLFVAQCRRCRRHVLFQLPQGRYVPSAQESPCCSDTGGVLRTRTPRRARREAVPYVVPQTKRGVLEKEHLLLVGHSHWHPLSAIAQLEVVVQGVYRPATIPAGPHGTKDRCGATGGRGGQVNVLGRSPA